MNLFTKGLYVGCTATRHCLIGVHVPINARAGMQWRNDYSRDEIEMMRDATNLRRWRSERVRFHGFYSKWFRRHLSHILDELED